MSQIQTDTLINTWISAVETFQPKNVLNCYDQRAVLVPTLSNQICSSHTQLEDYFNSFLAKKPQCVINEIYEHTISSSNHVIYAGIYTFTFDGNSTAKARFSFAYNDSKLIIHHHSSLLPN